MSKPLAKLFTLFVFCLILVSCNEEDPFKIDYSLVPDPFSLEGATKVETDSGLIYYKVKEGSGQYGVVFRDFITVYYTLRSSEGTIIKSSYINLNSQPVTASVSPTGNSSVFLHEGIQEGVLGMKNGGKRVLFVPPELHRDRTFPDDTIRVDLELDKIIL
ncbi:MAG: hypothetical protein FH748_08460 [Balneolaceae bacterium]|nr:hypothetical protein [Balneolaceae bacterium]